MKPFVQVMETKMVKGAWSVIVDQYYFAKKSDLNTVLDLFI